MLVRVRGRSMIPALRPGDFVWTKTAGPIERGQIVLVRNGDEGLLVKRVVGLPLETVTIQEGHVHINGKLLEEPYVPPSSFIEPQADKTWSLDQSSYIVLGDARDDSLDSRRRGPIPLEDIVGVVFCRLWPPSFAL